MAHAVAISDAMEFWLPTQCRFACRSSRSHVAVSPVSRPIRTAPGAFDLRGQRSPRARSRPRPLTRLCTIAPLPRCTVTSEWPHALLEGGFTARSHVGSSRTRALVYVCPMGKLLKTTGPREARVTRRCFSHERLWHQHLPQPDIGNSKLRSA